MNSISQFPVPEVWTKYAMQLERWDRVPVVGSREIDDEPVIGAFRAGHIKDRMSELSANTIVNGRNLRSTSVESGLISVARRVAGMVFGEARGTR